MIAAAGAASQLLSTLLSKLSSSYAPSSSSSTTPALTSAMQQAMPGDKTPPKPAPKPQLSEQTLLALVALQAQGSGAAPTNGSTASSDPVQKLFSVMDTDGDGDVSQSEMESYIEKQGGMQGQADSLFSAINQTNSATSGSSGVSESQMANAVSQAQQSQQARGSHHDHHHHKNTGTSDQTDNTASALLQALDGNDDGSASDNFAALNPSNSNALTSADFAKAYNAYQTQQNAQSPGSMFVSLLNQLASASGGTTSINA